MTLSTLRIATAALVVLASAGCTGPAQEADPARPDATTSTAVKAAVRVDEDAFWRIVEDARERGAGDPDAMAEVLEQQFADAHDDTLRGFQRRLVAANRRLYTWRHAAAADMVCGSVGDDGFTDWRSWVITLGRETFERIAADPDNLADVDDLTGGCALAAESFGAAVGGIYQARHGYDDESFPIVEPGGTPPAGTPPSGYPIGGTGALQATLPRLARRT